MLIFTFLGWRVLSWLNNQQDTLPGRLHIESLTHILPKSFSFSLLNHNWNWNFESCKLLFKTNIPYNPNLQFIKQNTYLIDSFLPRAWNKISHVAPDTSEHNKHATQSEWLRQNILEAKAVCALFKAIPCANQTWAGTMEDLGQNLISGKFTIFNLPNLCNNRHY